METKKLSSHIRKEQIVDAALKLLGESNVRKLKITDIATSLDLVPSALYRHFNSKDAILMAILDYIEKKFAANLKDVRKAHDNTIDRLHELLFRHVRLISQHHGIPRIVFSDEFWGQKTVKKRRLYELVSAYLGELERIIAEGQEKDEIRKDVDPAVAARMFLGIIQPGALLSFMSEGEFDIEEHAAMAWPVYKKILTDK